MPHKNFSFSFVDFKLVEVNFRVKNTADLDKEMEISTSLGIRHEWAEKEKVLKVFVALNITGPDSPLELSIEGGGLFKFDAQVEADRIERIACVNCAALIFPYIRETVSDFIRRAGFPPLYLPPFNFVQAYQDKTDAATEADQKNK